MDWTGLNIVWEKIFSSIIETVPTILFVTVLLIFGWILGNFLKKLTLEISKKLRLDDRFKIGKRIGLSEIISSGVSLIVYIAFIGAALDVANITFLSDFFKTIINFIGNLIGGIVVLVVGYAIAGFVQRKIVESNFVYSKIFGQIAFYFVIIITIEMALKVVNLPTNLLDAILIILVASLGLGLAIAIGLGFKDKAGKLIEKYIKD